MNHKRCPHDTNRIHSESHLNVYLKSNTVFSKFHHCWNIERDKRETLQYPTIRTGTDGDPVRDRVSSLLSRNTKIIDRFKALKLQLEHTISKRDGTKHALDILSRHECRVWKKCHERLRILTAVRTVFPCRVLFLNQSAPSYISIVLRNKTASRIINRCSRCSSKAVVSWYECNIRCMYHYVSRENKRTHFVFVAECTADTVVVSRARTNRIKVRLFEKQNTIYLSRERIFFFRKVPILWIAKRILSHYFAGSDNGNGYIFPGRTCACNALSVWTYIRFKSDRKCITSIYIHCDRFGFSG
jgi:hypothetical protein